MMRLQNRLQRIEQAIQRRPGGTMGYPVTLAPWLAQHRYLKVIEALAKVRRLLKEPKSPMMAVLLKQHLGIINRGK